MNQAGLTRGLAASSANALGLPTSAAGGRSFYRRLTLVVEPRVIVEVFDPVAAPADNAAEIVSCLETRIAEQRAPRSPEGERR